LFYVHNVKVEAQSIYSDPEYPHNSPALPVLKSIKRPGQPAATASLAMARNTVIANFTMWVAVLKKTQCR
jgi:hypothetical protein